MAKKTIEKFYSDISGAEIDTATPTVIFSFEGTPYEIDLTAGERSEFIELLNPYLNAARKASGGARRSRRSKPQSGSTSAKDIRAWAIEEGLTVPARGRVPADIIEAYHAAH